LRGGKKIKGLTQKIVSRGKPGGGQKKVVDNRWPKAATKKKG